MVTEDHEGMLDAAKLDYTKAVIFRTVSADLSHIDISKYDMLVFFSPAGIESLKKNFPDFVQNENVAIGGFLTTRIGTEQPCLADRLACKISLYLRYHLLYAAIHHTPLSCCSAAKIQTILQ